jgi:hypothetical protein
VTAPLHVPTGSAAREAWNALPGNVRAQAIWAAEHGEPHPDPAVAAVIVGAARHDRILRNHLTRLVAGLGATMFFTGWLTMYYYDHHREIEGRLWIPILIAFAGLLLIAEVRRTTTRIPPPQLRIGVPAHAEVTNLRALLQRASLGAATPLIVRRRWTTALTGLTALATAIATCSWVLIRWLDLPLPDNADSMPRKLMQRLLIPALVLAGIAVVRAIRNRTYRRARLTPDGVAFGRRRPIPWRDVLGVYLTGPRPSVPDADLTIEWDIQDRPRIKLDLDGLNTAPETIILTARTYATRRVPERAES